MSEIRSLMLLKKAAAIGNAWVFVRYADDGWSPGKLSPHTDLVTIGDEVFAFDELEDEFVEYDSRTREFLTRYPAAYLVRLGEMEYLVSDPNMTVAELIITINALRHNAKQSKLPPVDKLYAKYSVQHAAELCNPPILALHVE